MTPMTPIPDGSVVITPTEVYAEVRATGDAVRQLAAKLDGVPQQLSDHEMRLRALERLVWRAAGAGCVLGAGAGYAASTLGH
jgi:hypothetical protein